MVLKKKVKKNNFFLCVCGGGGVGETDMVDLLGNKVAIFDWEWEPDSREGQKIP